MAPRGASRIPSSAASRRPPLTATPTQTSRWSAAATRACGPRGTCSQRQPGIRVVVLERDECGFGPSGRNGGFINGFYDHAGELVDLFGREGALAMLHAGSRTLEELEAWMDRPRRRCLVPQGGIHRPRLVARPGRRLGGAARDRRGARGRGSLPAAVEGGAGRVLRLAGVRGRSLRGRWRHRPARPPGARPAAGRHGGTASWSTSTRRSPASGPATRLEVRTPRAGPSAPARSCWRSTPGPAPRSGSGPRSCRGPRTWPSRRPRRIGWPRSTGRAPSRSTTTAPRCATCARRPTGGSRSASAGSGGPGTGRIGPQFAYDERGTQHAIDAIHRLFPGFRDVPIDGRWGGPIDVAATHQPFAGTLRGGRVHYALGYTGNGVGPGAPHGQGAGGEGQRRATSRSSACRSSTWSRAGSRPSRSGASARPS